MMPVMKNDWNIYKCNRSRRVSECSNTSQACRSRKVSESKSEGPSLSTSPGSDYMMASPGNRSVPANMSRQYSRNGSRTSSSSLQSPSKSVASSPPKVGSQNSLNKFHNRLLDKLKRSLRSSSKDNERTSS